MTIFLHRIGKGFVWFLCPDTGKRWRNPYLINAYFLHRERLRVAIEKTTAIA